MSQMEEGSRHPMTAVKYTWDAARCVPYESTWSVLQKFARLNACNTRDIQREFGFASKRVHPHNWSDRDRDLNGWGALDPKTLQRSLGLSDVQLTTAVASTYIRIDEARVLASRLLRVCPECIQTGFHSPLHQLLFIRECPIHRAMLNTSCFECGKSNSAYSLVRGSFITPYGCGECGTVWRKVDNTVSHQSPEVAQQSLIMSEIAEWLTKRKDDRTVEADLLKLAKFTDNDQLFRASVRRLPHRWADVLGVQPPHNVGGNRDTDLHVVLESSTRSVTASPDPLTKQTLSTMYRAIRRHITKHLHREHQACFAKMGRGIWFPVIHREFDAKHFCQEAYALLLWRMFWEKNDIPQQLFSRQLLLVQPDMDFSTEWMPANIPREASIRLFGLECLRTYRRCLELGAQMQHKGRITFPMWRLASHKTGEWLIELPKAGTGYKIHWWWPKRWQHTLTFPAHSTTTTNKPAASSFWIAC